MRERRFNSRRPATRQRNIFHPYRRLWATERQHLSDVAVAAAGGWGDTQALKASYQKATKADVLRVVQGG